MSAKDRVESWKKAIADAKDVCVSINSMCKLVPQLGVDGVHLRGRAIVALGSLHELSLKLDVLDPIVAASVTPVLDSAVTAEVLAKEAADTEAIVNALADACVQKMEESE